MARNMIFGHDLVGVEWSSKAITGGRSVAVQLPVLP
jgi:hypothetical protein